MKTQLIKRTLVALALGGLGLLGTAAHAEDNRFGYSANARADYNQGGHDTRHTQRDFHHNNQFIQRVNTRQDRQRGRIIAGKRSGSLTRYEFRELMHEQRHMQAMERNFLADGSMNKQEFRRMDRALDRASRNIRAEKHDQQARDHHSFNRGYN